MPLWLRYASRRRPALRRGVCAVLLVAFVATAAGVPLPIAGRVQKSAELFPCSSCLCGCATAEQCWRACCCHTFAERWAWAQKNGVRPPDFAVAEAHAAGFDLAWLSSVGTGKLVCQAGGCCSHKHTANTRPCCQTKTTTAACCSQKPAATADQDSPRETSSRVVGWQAQKCAGHSMNWLAAVPIVMFAETAPEFQPLLASLLGPVHSDSPAGTLDAPVVPPPELA